MKAVVAAFNQEKALVGAFSVITNLRWNFLRHYPAQVCVVAGHLDPLVVADLVAGALAELGLVNTLPRLIQLSFAAYESTYAFLYFAALDFVERC